VSIVVVGVNHRSMPLEALERFTMGPDARRKLAYDLVEGHNLSEVVVLSTCNRTEVYGYVERFHPAYGDIRAALARYTDQSVDALGTGVYVHWGDEAVTHVFRVAAGLDSAVVGETEIVSQFRSAWAEAQHEDVCGTNLNQLMRQALEVAKRARSETTISAHTASVAGAAVEIAGLGSGRRRSAPVKVVVLGAGRMGSTLAKSLRRPGVELHIANRSAERAAEIAEPFQATHSGFLDLESHLVAADIVISATAAPGPVLFKDDVAGVIGQRSSRRLRLVDIAMPRDIDPGCGDLDGVELFDMDSISELIESGLERRRDEISSVEAIVQEEVARHAMATSAREAGPLIRDMRSRMEELRTAELDRYSAQLDRLSEQDRQLVESITKSLISKVAHNPTVRLKDTARTLRGDRLAEATRDLFDLS
jgi:glutamyl-tRNA reductase